ncbi:MAG: NADH-quinone oxidoreductase subunit C [candidate division FCPU426 bacterium]
MEKEQLIAAVTAKFPGIIADPAPSNLPGIVVPLADFRALMEFLLRDEAMSFDFPMCQTAVDWPERKVITSVYHLYSMDLGHKLVVKCELDRENPSIPTVSDLWRGCEWFERETYDMFGVSFENHPDLRRIMMTDDWVGYPLRKDYRDSRIAGKPY